MSYEGPVVDRLLSVAASHRGPRAVPRRDGAAARRIPTRRPSTSSRTRSAGASFQGFTAPVLDDRGGFLGRIWTLREVTQQRELDRLKDDFVATVSHELRTPLTSMMGFLEMIREGEAGAAHRRAAAVPRDRLPQLRAAAAPGRRPALRRTPRRERPAAAVRGRSTSTRSYATPSSRPARARAVARARPASSELADVPPVIGDHERLVAARRQPHLERAQVHARRRNGHRAGVRRRRTAPWSRSTDTGIGIPEAEQDRLFQRFFRSSTATEQAIPGTGLGLVISRAIAEAHGGTIDVRSQTGAGTPLPRRACRSSRGGGRGLRVVALDVGSSSVRAVAYDEDGDGGARRRAARLRRLTTPTSWSTPAAPCSRRSARAMRSRSPASGIRSSRSTSDDRPLTPVLTWRDLGGSTRRRSTRRTTTAAPAASSTRPTGRRSSAGCRTRAFGRRAISRSATTCCSASRARCARASRWRAAPGSSTPTGSTGTTRRSLRVGVDRAAASAGLRRAGRRRLPRARRRRLLERRRRLRRRATAPR